MIKTNHDHLKFLLRYILAGGIVTLIDIILFMYLVNFFSNLTTAFSINYFVGVIVSFIFHGKITFMQKNYKFSKLPFFFIFYISSYFIGLSVIILYNNFFDYILIGKIVQIFICTLFNIYFYSKYVFSCGEKL